MKKLLFSLGLCFTLVSSLFGGGSNSVSLAWNHSPDTSVIGYNIYYGGGSGAYTNHQTTGYTNKTTIYGLPDGTYYFTATAFNTDLESAFSNEVMWQTSTNGGNQLLPVQGLTFINTNNIMIPYSKTNIFIDKIKN